MTPDLLPPRMAAKVIVDDNGCWLWTGALNGVGYGKVRVAGTHLLAHRVSYWLLVGLIPRGLQMDHACRVRNCCNPQHLEPVTAAENSRRIPRPPRAPRSPRLPKLARTHCQRGHEWSAENVYVRPNGKKECRECHAMWRPAARQREKRQDPARTP